jgi:DNA-binding response OmpR family regulator
LRRCEAPPAPTVIRAGDLEIDALAMVLTVRGAVTTATATEFRLLHYLARHAGRVFTRDQILDAVWKDTAFVSPRSVDVYVRKLRSKIEVDPEQPRYLRTVRGAGYRFESPKN